jgi:hypothetical protein
MDIEKPSQPKGDKKSPDSDVLPQSEPRKGGFFGWFNRGSEAPAKPAPEKTPEVKDPKPDKKSVGEKLLQLLRIEPKKDAPVDAKKAEISPEQPASATPVETAEKLTLAERALVFARKVGQGALDALRSEKESVQVADAKDKDPTAEPTDTKPLDKAEGDVREALGEVDHVSEKVAASVGSTPEAGPSWDYKTHQAAETARAWLAADRAIEAEKHRRDRTESRVLGTVAIGGGLLAAGVGLVNWLEVRAVRREQRQAKKRDEAVQRQAEETHEEIVYNRQKLEELRHTQLEDLDRRQRQEHVYAVSEYAEAQAERIREVAKTQEKLAEKAVASVVETPQKRASEKTEKQAEKAPERKRMVERVAEIVNTSKNNAREGLGGAIGGAVGGVVDLLTGRRVQPQTPAEPVAQQTPQPKPAQAVQTWLNGTLLILGVVLMIVILLAIG